MTTPPVYYVVRPDDTSAARIDRVGTAAPGGEHEYPELRTVERLEPQPDGTVMIVLGDAAIRALETVREEIAAVTQRQEGWSEDYRPDHRRHRVLR